MSKDLAKAVDYQRRAALQGHALSQYELGMMLWARRAAEKDAKQCREYFQSAAEGGLAAAQATVAMCYTQGLLGLEEDLDKARWWYEQAARQGHLEATLILKGWPPQ